MSFFKPMVVGIYGTPGVGKTRLMNHLKDHVLGVANYAFYDGSEVIETVYDSGLAAFQELPACEQEVIRREAIASVRAECLRASKVGIVTGHVALWNGAEARPEDVYTSADMETYSCIFYLEGDPELIRTQILHDTAKARTLHDVEHITRLQDYELDQLHELCYEHGILAVRVKHGPTRLDDDDHHHPSAALIKDVLGRLEHVRTEAQNDDAVRERLDAIMAPPPGNTRARRMFVLDADKTLAPFDTGDMFWALEGRADALKKLFGNPGMKYRYRAFWQACLLYECEVDPARFEQLCERVAGQVVLYPQMEQLLRQIAAAPDTGAVVVTCGLRPIWEKVLDRAGFSAHVKVIGGGRIDNGYVVTKHVKGVVVRRLQQTHRVRVCAIGDSTLDLAMLRQADVAAVIMGDGNVRGQSLSARLLAPTGMDGLAGKTYQIPLPPEQPALDLDRLPRTDLEAVFADRWRLNFLHATDTSASKLLTAPTRDADVAGRALQRAHREVGRYLAREYLADLLGLEEYEMAHVQGGATRGHRVRGEADTLIVALMRGGEPMALGVHDALPRAGFLHAAAPQAITRAHLAGRAAVVLVDSVVNSGQTIAEHVNHVRALAGAARVAVVAGVVQRDAVHHASSPMLQALHGLGTLELVALRVSDNKFTGRGGTDTGNRLFNTTQLKG